MPKVRTTINPTVELDVSERELRGLKAEGLVLDTRATTPEGLTRAGEAASLKREGPMQSNGPDDGDLTTVDDNDENFNSGTDDDQSADDDQSTEV